MASTWGMRTVSSAPGLRVSVSRTPETVTVGHEHKKQILHCTSVLSAQELYIHLKGYKTIYLGEKIVVAKYNGHPHVRKLMCYQLGCPRSSKDSIYGNDRTDERTSIDKLKRWHMLRARTLR
jgi:hypothetical protein